MLVAEGFYANPVPGFIFTAFVCGCFAAVAVWIWLKNFGPAARNARKRADAEGPTQPAHRVDSAAPAAATAVEKAPAGKA